jgi:hypothetical protein
VIVIRDNAAPPGNEEKPASIAWEVNHMLTGILAIVIGFVGLGLIIAGAFGGVVLMAERADRPVPREIMQSSSES